MNIKFTINFYIKHWKEGIHLLFRTKRFGVNDKWYSDFDSMFGWHTHKIIWSIIKIKPIIENYKMMKFRAAACHVLSEETNKKLGWYRFWDNKKQKINV